MANPNQKNSESIEALRQSLQYLFNEHVHKLLEIMNTHVQMIKPNEIRHMGKVISSYNQEVGAELNTYSGKLTDKTTFFLNQVDATSLEQGDVIATINTFIQPDLYSKRFDIFLQALKRQTERFGVVSGVSEQGFELPRSLAVAHSHNKCREIQNGISTAVKTIYLSTNFSRGRLAIHKKLYLAVNQFYEEHPLIFWILSMAIPAIFATVIS